MNEKPYQHIFPDRRHFRRIAVGITVVLLLALLTPAAHVATTTAQTGTTATIGGCIYTGGGSVTYTINALGEPIPHWNTVYHDPNATYNPGDPGAPILDAKVMVQNQHSGGAFITYGTVDPNTGCWTATVPAPGDYIVMFSAPGHDSTSREFTVDASGNARYPDPSDPACQPSGICSGNMQDAYLPPLQDLNGDGVAAELPRANLLHYVFYDEFVNGNDDGPLIDPPLNGVTVRVYDEEGNLLAQKVTGAEPFVTADGLDFTAPGSYDGYVYFTDLPPGELILESDPSTVTQAANPHFTLHKPDTGREWYLTYTEEGGPTWEVNLYPGDPGTEAGMYMTWHGFIEKLGNDAGCDPASGICGSINGVLLDADGNDPQEPFPITLGGRVNSNSGYVTGMDVEPNSRIPYGAVALYTLGDSPRLVATAEATQPTGQNDPNGGEFTFTNVPPGQYEIYAWDIPLKNVPVVGTGVTVNPGPPSQVMIFMPRFGARAQGYVMKDGAPVQGARVKVHYESGITKQETTTDASGWFNFDFLPEIEVMGHVVVDLPDGATYRGKIITEQFDPDGAGPSPAITVTHNAMNRYVQWMTYNYFVDIQLEDIPPTTGDINGVVFYDHFQKGTWQGDGLYDEYEEPVLQGVTVKLYDSTGTTVITTTTTGAFDETATAAQGWDEPYTWPPNEIGGVFAGPALGFYEFRDLAPGQYMVEVIPPPGFQRSPALPEKIPVTVTGGHSTRMDLGVNTRPLASDPVGVPLAGEIEGGVFDDNNLDMNPLSLLFQEKAGVVGAPVGVYDHYNYLLGMMYMGDPLCYTGSTVCPPGEITGQKPEAERRFAPGVHRYLGNDPAFPSEDVNGNGVLDPGEDLNGNGRIDGFNSNFTPFELGYSFPQGGYKFEADWSLLPAALAGGGPVADMCVTSLVGTVRPAETWGAQVTVTVSDGFTPIAGARVVGSWSTTGIMECKTNGSGQCTIVLEKVEPGNTPSVTFDVLDVVPANTWYAYNPAATGLGCVTSTTINNPNSGGGGSGGGGGTTKVTALSGQGVTVEGTKWRAQVTLTVENGAGPVSGYKVIYTWNPGESKTCKTNANGQCTVKSQTIENPNITAIDFTVNNVIDPNPNGDVFDPANSITHITINRP